MYESSPTTAVQPKVARAVKRAEKNQMRDFLLSRFSAFDRSRAATFNNLSDLATAVGHVASPPPHLAQLIAPVFASLQRYLEDDVDGRSVGLRRLPRL